ncbi:MAG: DUF1223 domain-containing protein [Hyphomonadaceae bacterium]
MRDIPEHPERPSVVELFSSQSCGNCPQANRNVAEMATRGDVIVLTYPVGYWNYLGWDDTFAKPEFSERQKDYNRVLGHRGPYTPQIVFSGRLHSSGVNLPQIAGAFARRDITPYPARISFAGGDVAVDGDWKGDAWVVLVRVRPGSISFTPKGGANEGRPMTYYNLVTSIETLGRWTGGQTAYHTNDCGKGCTILVQDGGPTGKVIGAAQRR